MNPSLGEVAYNEYQSQRGWADEAKAFELLDDTEKNRWELLANILTQEIATRWTPVDLVMQAMEKASVLKQTNTPLPEGRAWAIVCTELEKVYAYIRVWLT